MGENSDIQWTHHTFNPWIGCTKVSPACDHCYAEAYDQRWNGGVHWGPKAPRRRTAAANWRKPLGWNSDAIANGTRYRVFCASLADVFDNQVPTDWRHELWTLIRATPHLDWLLLTKRPQNIHKMLPADWADGYRNVWLGTTVENQREAARRVPHLLAAPAVIHFLSCEPLLGPVEIQNFLIPTRNQGTATFTKLDWVIAGGESGPSFRPAEPDWFRSLRDQCAANDIAFLFKQWDGPSQVAIKRKGRLLDDVLHDAYPIPRAA
jgi:protein gp37